MSSTAPSISQPGPYELTHLQALEAEAIHIIREVAAEFERPVLLFSGARTRRSCCTSPSRRSPRPSCRSR